MMIKNWKYYINFYKSDKKRLLIIGVASVAASFVMLPVAFAVRTIFEKSIPGKNYNELIIMGILLIVIQLFNHGLLAYIRYTTLDVTKSIITKLRIDLINKFYDLSNAYYSKTNIAKLHTMLVQDTERLDIMSNAVIAIVIPAILTNIILIPVLIYLNKFLFITLLAILPISLLFCKILGRKVRNRISAFHRAFETFSKGILFILNAVDLTRVAAAEKFETTRQADNAENLKIISQNMAWLQTVYQLIQEEIMSVISALIIILGGMSVINGTTSLGELISFFFVLTIMRRHLLAINENIPRIIEGSESLKSLASFINNPDRKPYAGTRKIEFNGSIELRDLHFGYTEKKVVKGTNLKISNNSSIAILGPNGSGKTTLINLILGLYAPCRGTVLANGIPYNELDIHHLRRFFGVVRQNPLLFSGSVRENICYGCPDVKEKEMLAAAELASARDFIENLPKGLDTQLGKNGELLSGGQQQRIAITRALLHNPRLLIFDEPTIHLDHYVIKQLTENLIVMNQNRAIIMVTHDRYLAKTAQKIYCLDEGVLIEQDPESDLLINSKTYA